MGAPIAGAACNPAGIEISSTIGAVGGFIAADDVIIGDIRLTFL